MDAYFEGTLVILKRYQKLNHEILGSREKGIWDRFDPKPESIRLFHRNYTTSRLKLYDLLKSTIISLKQTKLFSANDRILSANDRIL